jgi:hypothetical protein
VALAWHVDYWDYLGWKDPYGAKAHTARQKAYVPVLKTKGLVTPQILVDNERTREYAATIEKKAKEPAGVVIRSELTVKGRKLTAKITLEDAGVELPKKAVVRAVLFQRKAETKVTAGENKGKTLTEYFIVLKAHAPLPASKALEKGVEAKLELPEGVETSNLGLAVLVEDPEAMKTHESAAFDLPEKKAR